MHIQFVKMKRGIKKKNAVDVYESNYEARVRALHIFTHSFKITVQRNERHRT